MKHTILILSLLCVSCASYKETFPAYTQAKVEIARAQALADAAYYQMMAARFNADAEVKKAALARTDTGGTVIFIGSDGGQNIAPVHKPIVLAAPDPAPGAQYALEFGKAAIYGGAAAYGVHEVFGAIKAVSGAVSNVSNISNSNTETNANTTTTNTDESSTVTVSDSGNQTDNSKSMSVADSGNADNSINTGDVDMGNKDNSTNTADSNNDMSNNSDNSDQSDNSDNSDNSNHDNDYSTTEYILPDPVTPDPAP